MILKKHKKFAVLAGILFTILLLIGGFYIVQATYRYVRNYVLDEYKAQNFDLVGAYDNDAQLFKAEYEFYNGKEHSHGNIMRSLDIAEDNPIVYAFTDDILSMIEDEKSFAVYFGFPTCPWCRLSLESILQAAESNHIEKLYYVNVHEIRDQYELKEEVCIMSDQGTKGYQTLLNEFDNVLDAYTLTNEKGEEIEVGEKRIYAPTVVIVKDGKAIAKADSNALKGNPYDEQKKQVMDQIYQTYDDLFKLIDD